MTDHDSCTDFWSSWNCIPWLVTPISNLTNFLCKPASILTWCMFFQLSLTWLCSELATIYLRYQYLHIIQIFCTKKRVINGKIKIYKVNDYTIFAPSCLNSGCVSRDADRHYVVQVRLHEDNLTSLVQKYSHRAMGIGRSLQIWGLLQHYAILNWAYNSHNFPQRHTNVCVDMSLGVISIFSVFFV